MATQARPTDPMLQRMLGALRLDRATYEDIEKDRAATGQAAFIVVATSALAGAVSYVITGEGGGGDGILGAIGALIGWAVYAWLAFVLGTRVFPSSETKADWGELARTLGFANTPRFLYVFALVPGFASIVQVVVGIWVLIGTIIALQSALELSVGRAVVIAIAASLAQALIFAVALSVFA